MGEGLKRAFAATRKAPKLSKAMVEVLAHMDAGWELAQSQNGHGGHTWLQQGGAGRGGQSKSVSASTVHSLWTRNLIVQTSREFESPTRFKRASQEA